MILKGDNMNKRVKLLDYEDRKHFFIIKDFENVDTLVFQIISGDGVLTVIYKDKKQVHFDSSEDRLINFDDGIWVIEPKDIGVLNRMKDCYDTDELDKVCYGD